jgi:hypothetical protein
MSPHAQDDVPTGTNNWWKEATVYQVSQVMIISMIRINWSGVRSTRPRFTTPMVMAGVIFLG